MSNGKLYYSEEVVVTIWCEMIFESYPMDWHQCPFRIGSYVYPVDMVKFSTEKMFFKADYMPGISITYGVNVTMLESNETNVTYDSGTYSLCGFRLHLTRSWGRYIYNYFLPSGLFVIVSWVCMQSHPINVIDIQVNPWFQASFLIPPDNIAGRMGLLITLFLVLINLFVSVLSIEPKTRKMTPLSIWTITCILFVFGALSGYVVILLLKYHVNSSADSNLNKVDVRFFNAQDKLLFTLNTKKIDRTFLLIATCSFTVFNIFFWFFIIHN